MPLLFPTEDLAMPLYKPVPYNPDDLNDIQRLTRDDQTIDYDDPVYKQNPESISGIYPYK